MAAVGDIFKVTVHHSIPNTSAALNVFYFQLKNVPADDADVKDALATFFIGVWCDAWAELASDTASADFASVDVMNPNGTVLRVLGTFTIGVTGAVLSGQTSPAAVAAFMLANTAIPKVYGRKYLPGIAEGAIDQGVLTSTALADLSAMLILYLAEIGLSGITLQPGVISKLVTGFVPFDASGQVTDVPAYQRRRKPGVGA